MVIKSHTGEALPTKQDEPQKRYDMKSDHLKPEQTRCVNNLTKL